MAKDKITQHIHGHGNIITGSGDINLQVDPETLKQYRLEFQLLARVKDIWIDNYLNISQGESPLDIPIQQEATLVRVPFSNNIEITDQSEADLSLYERFQKGQKHILIVGEPGAGKTILALQVLKAILEENLKSVPSQIPVVLHLSSWQPAASFEDFFISELRKRYRVSKQVAQKLIEEDKFVFFLEGFDEIREKYRSTFIKRINQYGEQESTAGIIITSRRAEYETTGEVLQFDLAVSLSPLGKAQVTNYLEQSGAIKETREITQLSSLLDEESSYSNLLRNPLNLYIASEVLKSRPTFFSGAHEVVDETTLKKRLYFEYLRKNSRRKGKNPPERPVNQFVRWVQQFLTFKDIRRPKHYARKLQFSHLKWLAGKLQAVNKSYFRLDDLQPDILSNPVVRWIYTYLSNFISLFIVMLGFLQLENMLIDNPSVTEWSASNEAMSLVAVGGLSLVFTLLDQIRLSALFRRMKRRLSSFSLAGLYLVFTTAFFDIVFRLLAKETMEEIFDRLYPSSEIIVNNFFIAFGAALITLVLYYIPYLIYRNSGWSEDIVLLESFELRFSLKRLGKYIALFYLLPIFVLSLFFGLSGAAAAYDIPMGVFILGMFLLTILMGSPALLFLLGISLVRRKNIAEKVRPYEGITNTLKNLAFLFIVGLPFIGLIAYLTEILALFTIDAAFEDAKEAMEYKSKITGQNMAIDLVTDLSGMLLIICGIFDLIKYYSLRIILFIRRKMPLFRYVDLLNSCVQLNILRRVGGGYLFFHQDIMEYLAQIEEQEIKDLVEDISLD